MQSCTNYIPINILHPFVILVCIAGFFMDNVTSVCAICTIGSWSPGGSREASCILCGAGMTTNWEGATDSSDCGKPRCFSGMHGYLCRECSLILSEGMNEG